MPANRTPIYPNQPACVAVNVPVSSTADVTLFTADATYGSIITSINCYENAAPGANNHLFWIKISSVKYNIARVAMQNTANAVANLLTATNFKMVDNTRPKILLPPGASFGITPSASVAGTYDYYIEAAHFLP